MDFVGKIAKIKEKIVYLYNKNKKIFIGAVVCFFGFVVLIYFYFFNSKKSSTSIKNNSVNISISDYTDMVENKLENMLSTIKNISFVNVFVMVDSLPINNYLFETENSKNTNSNGIISEINKSSIVYEKNGSNSTPVLVSTTLPKITGVLIVTSKINTSTKLSIINSVSIVLNVDESCITLLQEG